MTERWRKRLGDLDKTGPSSDLYERAKGGPQLPEEPYSRPSTTTRIVTGVAAFLVFALAISVFAIPALRLKGSSSALGTATQPLPLWPVRTLDAVRALQAKEDDTSSYLGDPQEVARAFGTDVMGWSDVQVQEVAPAATVPEIGITCSPDPIGSACGASSPAGWVGYQPFPPGWSPEASPFRTFKLETPCVGGACVGPTEFVTVFQPDRSGPGGVWMVLRAQADGITLSDEPGEVVSEGQTVHAYGSDAPGDSILGYQAGEGDCSTSSATTAFVRTTTPGPDPSAGGNAAGVGSVIYGAARAELQVTLPAIEGCAGPQAGYLYAASFDPIGASNLGDPIVVTGATVTQLSAVPALFEFPKPEVSTSSVSPTNEPFSWTTYTDPLGWTIDVPKDWVTQTIDGSDARLTYEGAAFGSAPLEQAPGGPTTINPPPDQVMLMITHREGGPADAPADDSTFPLSYDDLSLEEGLYISLTGTFRGDGLPFDLVVEYTGPTDQQVQILRHMVASIRFKPWELGETRHGWTAIGPVLPAASAEWIIDKLHGQHYVASFSDPGRQLLGPAPLCAAGAVGSYEVRETGVAGLRCPDGTGGDWDFRTGAPQPGNTSGYDTTLASYPAIRSWDGMLLAQLPPTG